MQGNANEQKYKQLKQGSPKQWLCDIYEIAYEFPWILSIFEVIHWTQIYQFPCQNLHSFPFDIFRIVTEALEVQDKDELQKIKLIFEKNQKNALLLACLPVSSMMAQSVKEMTWTYVERIHEFLSWLLTNVINVMRLRNELMAK